MASLGPSPRNANPVPRSFRGALARMQRSQRKLQHEINTRLSGGRTGVVGVGIFGKRFGVIRRYGNAQAYQNELTRLTNKNFLKMSLQLEFAIDRIIEQTWAQLERQL